MRWARALWLVVGSALVAIAMAGAANDAAAEGSPGCTSVGGIHACNGGSSRLPIEGTSKSGGGSASGGGGGPAPITSISVTCGAGGEAQLAGLGDSAPPLTQETCADQTVACATQGAAEKKKLDPVVTVTKQDDGTWQYSGNECVENGPARVTPALVREEAVRLIPTATVGLAPRGTTLVNIETVMWADAPREKELEPVTILDQSVVVRIVLDHVSWRFGDGESEPNGPAGKAYDGKRDPCREKSCKHYFGHVYGKTGSVTVSATATWHASFSVAGGAPVDIPGTVDGPASQADIVIKQARGVLVPNPGEQP